IETQRIFLERRVTAFHDIGNDVANGSVHVLGHLALGGKKCGKPRFEIVFRLLEPDRQFSPRSLAFGAVLPVAAAHAAPGWRGFNVVSHVPPVSASSTSTQSTSSMIEASPANTSSMAPSGPSPRF